MKILSKAYNYFTENTKNILSKRIGKVSAGLCICGVLSSIFGLSTGFFSNLVVGVGIIAGSFLLIEMLFGLVRQDYPDKKRKNTLLLTSCLLLVAGVMSHILLEKSSIISYAATMLIVSGVLGAYLRMTIGMVEYLNKNLEQRLLEISSKISHNLPQKFESVSSKEEMEEEKELELTYYFKK